MRILYFLMVCAIAMGVPSALAGDGANRASGIDYQKTADIAPWSWHEDQIGPIGTLAGVSSDYEVSISMKPGHGKGLDISIVKKGKTIYQWMGHRFSVFKLVGDRLFYAEFNPNREGGTIIAVDLIQGKPIWTTRLIGLSSGGPIEHSGYVNKMNLNATSEAVTVYGLESGGRYIEIKSTDTGATLGHKIFKEIKERRSHTEPEKSERGQGNP
jgi:hypothetical protein